MKLPKRLVSPEVSDIQPGESVKEDSEVLVSYEEEKGGETAVNFITTLFLPII